MSAALSAASAEPSSGSRSGRTAGPPRRAAAGMAARRTTSSELRRLSRTTGRAAASPRWPSIARTSARTSGGAEPAFSTQRSVASVPGIFSARRSAEPRKARSGLSAAAEEVRQGLGPDGRDDEGEGRRRVLRLPGSTVVLEDRAGRTQPFGRPARLEQAPGVEEVERGRGRSLLVRGGHARPRERGPRHGIADVGQGEQSRLAQALVSAVRRGGGSSSPPRASAPLRAPRRAPGGRFGGALSRDARSALVACGPPMETSTPAAGPARVSSTRYLSRGRMDSCFPTSRTCERKNAATGSSFVLPRASRRTRTKRARSASAPGRMTWTARPFTANRARASSPFSGGRTRAHTSATASGPSARISAQRAPVCGGACPPGTARGSPRRGPRGRRANRLRVSMGRRRASRRTA